MQLYVKVEAKNSKLTWPSYNYISDYQNFNIKCKICDEDVSLSKDKYELYLRGTEENIQSFISYLRTEGFKVEY